MSSVHRYIRPPPLPQLKPARFSALLAKTSAPSVNAPSTLTPRLPNLKTSQVIRSADQRFSKHSGKRPLRNATSYHQFHPRKSLFKGRDDSPAIAYRQMHLPGANEALAEAVLLAECSKYPAFQNPTCVFSYQLAGPDDTEGVFQHYFKGLQRRHECIAQACRRHDRPIVRYADVRRFYPSIPPDSARGAWEAACSQAALPVRLKELGYRLIDGQLSVARDGDATLLTGPMFTHLIGSLVLRGVDGMLASRDDVAYCRYVDDIVLVGPKDAVDDAYRSVGERLDHLGLELHPPESGKHLVVDGETWLLGEHDFQDSPAPIQWKTFIGGLKWLLTSAPERRLHVQNATRRHGFRLPIPDYTAAVREIGYLDRLKTLVPLHWFKKKRRSLDELMAEGQSLRDRYLAEIDTLLAGLHDKRGYDWRRTVPKIRYRAGRLAYLASHQQLGVLAERMREVDDLELHAVVLMAVATGDVTDVIQLGANAAQAVAQPLHAEGRQATVQGPIKSAVEAQGLAVLALNGVDTSGAGDGPETRSEFLRLARDGVSADLMRSKDPFVREFASLHGLEDEPRHAHTLDTAFDAADEAVFDTVSQAVYAPSDW